MKAEEHVKALLEAIDTVGHSHDATGHGQRGNPFYGYWTDGMFRCPLCLAAMRAEGHDVAFEFTRHLPFSITRVNLHLKPWSSGWDYEAVWWKQAYLFTLPYVDDRWGHDREWMRERLADALARGMAEARSAGRVMAWVGE